MSLRHNNEVSAKNEDKGMTPENPADFAATLWSDLMGRTGREVLAGLQAEFPLMSRGQNVEDCSKLSLNRLKVAWAGSEAYDTAYNDA